MSMRLSDNDVVGVIYDMIKNWDEGWDLERFITFIREYNINLNKKYWKASLLSIFLTEATYIPEIVNYIARRSSKKILNEQNIYSNATVLHYAVENNDLDLVKYLIKEDVDLFVKNNIYDTAIDCAIEGKNKEMIKIIGEYACKKRPNFDMSEIQTALDD
jgi:hypothetical protein